MKPVPEPGPPELWGGVECSVVRVGAGWRDQVAETGHHRRAADLDRLAAAGIRTLRYPVLWERVATQGWDWQDARMARLQRLGITPIAGLVHHGSGPAGTDLLDDGFATGLAAHAAAAAARYPWVTHWTPVNEPLTTARFSGLYGHWHPGHRNEDAMLRMLAVQCDAILQSVRAIRAHIPHARFVHTEDLGRVFATPRMQDQADYENGRRWLSLDLLCGRVGREHPWRPRLLAAGVSPALLDALRTAEAAPDLIGVNHYATSDRFLDHRTALYPPHLHGGNGRVAYADTEAARMDLPESCTGWLPRLWEVWDRYRRPMAITEAHLGDNPAEQVRWLMEAWDAATVLRVAGVDVRAVTAWALFGLVDWHCMLRDVHGRMEPGAWDARHDPPQPTLLAHAVAALATHGAFDHPCLDTPGWWRCPDRFHPAALSA